MGFRKPGEKKLGGKFLSYGKKATSKTTFLLTFPKIAALDTETGMSFYEGTNAGKNLVLVSNSQSYKSFEDDLDDISENYEEYGVETFAVDSVTKVKENLEETIMLIDEKRERSKGKSVDETNLSIRSRGRIKYVNKKLQNMKIDLSTRGINVVDIAQAKEIKEKQGDQFVLVGHEPDMQKGSEHDYDVVLYHYTETDGRGNTKFMARVEKDRLGVFKVGQTIENPSYEMWASVFDKRKDKDTLDVSFVQESEDGKHRYEEQQELDEKTWKDKFTILIPTLEDDKKKELMETLKATKITDFDKLTPKKREDMIKIYEQFA